jgi:hypothetical protein
MGQQQHQQHQQQLQHQLQLQQQAMMQQQQVIAQQGQPQMASSIPPHLGGSRL